ncbi:ABC transporter substrate-binding protein [Morganella morganii]
MAISALKRIFSAGVLLLFFNCAGAKEITDLAGNRVTIPDKVERIAVVPIPWMSMIYVVDGSDAKIAGMHPSAKEAYRNSILKTLAPGIEKVNSTFVNKDFTINGEELVRLNPDLVIIWDYQKEEKEKLDKLGIPAVAIRYGDLDDVKNGIRLLGDILGKEKRAADLLAFFDHQIESVNTVTRDSTPVTIREMPYGKPGILYVRDKNLTVAGKTSVNSLMINRAGGINLTDDMPVKPNWITVSAEQVINLDPEIIILSQFDSFVPEDVYRNTVGWQGTETISAVKNRRVYKAPIGIYRWDAPGIETPLMMKWIEARVKRKPIDDAAIHQDIRQFFKQFFGTDLTDAQMREILSLDANMTGNSSTGR